MKTHGLHWRQLLATIVLLVCPLALVSARSPFPPQQANPAPEPNPSQQAAPSQQANSAPEGTPPQQATAPQQAKAGGPDDPNLSNEEIKKFLLTAKIVNVKESGKGITAPKRFTLSEGAITHDGSFQAIDEHKPSMQDRFGRTELNFVDSYKYNIAAYKLAEMLGLEDIIPVYVERKWQGNTGSLSWWLPVQMDEADRLKQKIPVPQSASDTWNKRMYEIRVFDALVLDTDPNLTNVLIDREWKPWRVDFSRAFRQSKDIRDPKDLVRCNRALLERLKALNFEQVVENTKPYLNKSEVKALMARRDKIVETFQKLIAQKGEGEVLY